jgi:hypothetical protein
MEAIANNARKLDEIALKSLSYEKKSGKKCSKIGL